MSVNASIPHHDAVVVGAGFSGIYSVVKLTRDLGLNVLGLERGAGVGGTWYWNRYPGVKADTDSFVYRYSFDDQVSPRWDIGARYQDGSQIRDYLDSIAERHAIKSKYRFNTVARSAEYDSGKGQWSITTDAGDRFTATYLISAAGVLSRPVIPEINNLKSFEGDVLHTARWPQGFELDGLRVGIIGNGSTGSQLFVAASKVASHITVFQRSAQYVVPAGERRLDAGEVENYLGNFHERWDHWRRSRLACGFEDPGLGTFDVDPERREAVFERAWTDGGGFGFMFGTFNDLAFNPAANQAAADFIVRKIRRIVRDPEVAARLIPDQPYAKRPVSVDGFYDAFNQPNVTLVSLRQTPIVTATRDGLVTADGREHVLDVLILATGFEAVEGAYRDLAVIGRDGRGLLKAWGEKPSAYLGIFTPGFPNFFTVLGPQTALCRQSRWRCTSQRWCS